MDDRQRDMGGGRWSRRWMDVTQTAARVSACTDER